MSDTQLANATKASVVAGRGSLRIRSPLMTGCASFFAGIVFTVAAAVWYLTGGAAGLTKWMHEAPLTDTTAPPKVIIKIDPQETFPTFDVCALLTLADLSKGMRKAERLSCSALDTTQNTGEFVILHSHGSTDQYVVQVGSPNNKTRTGKGLEAVMAPSAHLAVVVGSEPVPRSEAQWRVMDYVLTNDLLVDNGQMIIADKTLRPLFGTHKQVSRFAMHGILNDHLTPATYEIDWHDDTYRAYLVPSSWTLHVRRSDAFQLDVSGQTSYGVLRMARLLLRRLEVDSVGRN